MKSSTPKPFNDSSQIRFRVYCLSIFLSLKQLATTKPVDTFISIDYDESFSVSEDKKQGGILNDLSVIFSRGDPEQYDAVVALGSGLYAQENRIIIGTTDRYVFLTLIRILLTSLIISLPGSS